MNKKIYILLMIIAPYTYSAQEGKKINWNIEALQRFEALSPERISLFDTEDFRTKYRAYHHSDNRFLIASWNRLLTQSTCDDDHKKEKKDTLRIVNTNPENNR